MTHRSPVRSHGRTHVRRGAALAAVSALAVTGLGALAPAPASAAPPYDPAPLQAGATWLQGQLTDGLIHNEQYDFDDYGLSVDVGLAVAEIDQSGTATEISDALAPHVADYYSYAVYDDAGNATGDTHVTAGSVAKAAAFAQAAGEDPTGYGGQDLVSTLEDRTGDDGRIGDAFFPEDSQYEADFANTIGQAFAVRALTRAGSSEAGAATDFLLDQQCAEGYFRLSFTDSDAADQTCDGASDASANTDATALAVIELQASVDGDDSPDVAAALQGAVTWLEDNQRADGSFGSEAPTTAPNANSTGLAGWALGQAGEAGDLEAAAAAEAAAVWVRGRQADDVPACPTALDDEDGAIAYTDSALSAGRADGIVVQTQDQFRRATAQALPALEWAPENASGEPADVDTSGFRRAGSTVALASDELVPGDTACFTRGADVTFAAANATGQALATTTLPAGTGDRTYRANTDDGLTGTTTYRALDKATLGLAEQARRRAGAEQRVVVSGLQPGEPVKVSYRGKKVRSGEANGQGRFATVFRVGQKLGPQKVVAVGGFADRRGSDTFRVVK